MPYIACSGNRYLAEHSCDQHHYGNQALVRPCCVADARQWKENTLRVAITTDHPSYRIFNAAFNSLTEAEQELVGDIVPVYEHGPAGFEPRGWKHAQQLELL